MRLTYSAKFYAGVLKLQRKKVGRFSSPSHLITNVRMFSVCLQLYKRIG